ncbi:hypothetical protein HJFPF1_08776 [Paramyrothecium foliicola]|nr:hypothetical protein HJFPF1_08776 [Paramyrothecium foliicola]
MFATQQYMDASPDPARKRIREDDDDLVHGISSFSEHRNKRLQSLPLRTSPRASQQTLPNSLNHSEPSSNSHLNGPQFSQWSSSPAVEQHQQQDAEMDMMDAACPPALHTQANAARFHPEADSNTSAGRMPTPIQPSFAAQIRGQQCEWAGPGPSISPNGVANLGHHVTGMSDQHTTPRILSTEVDWHNVHNNRRLPSPISEAEDPTSNVFPDASAMHMNANGMQHHLQGQADESSLHADQQQHYMEHPNASMDVEAMHAAQHAAESEGDAASPSPGRRGQGHMRSKHTINNWTWQPGMKKSFSIGYRADCEKCRLKVPGHFNHIIIS